MASVVLRQKVLGDQIISTLHQCGLGKSDFEVIQKMEHDGSYIPTPTKTVFGEIVINILNLQAVIDHVEEIGKVYRVNILMKNDQPLHAAIEHNNGTGVHLHPLQEAYSETGRV